MYLIVVGSLHIYVNLYFGIMQNRLGGQISRALPVLCHSALDLYICKYVINKNN